ncbi:pentapeptide repeat-containing protein [Leekyejoonella antrihumi]|uniref:Pentapeptide repeat-containing protein n=2 Tax=Leekyejoonella antrihumi TaxID=1660198 RepID=A0A563E285_9MICO|nr:pentapeptide repeat-containing protein [Leekyejoonella antrihumi]
MRQVSRMGLWARNGPGPASRRVEYKHPQWSTYTYSTRALSTPLDGSDAGRRCHAAGMELTEETYDGPGLRAAIADAVDPPTLTRCSLVAADLRDADLTEVRFVDCAMDGALLDGAMLGQAVFDGCRLMGASFKKTRGFGFSLRRCNLFAADLTAAPLSHEDLTGCRFTEANLRSADLRDAVLDGCDLLHADLYQAKLTGADLRGAALGPCDLDRLKAMKGAIITTNQAAQILVDLAGVTITPS